MEGCWAAGSLFEAALWLVCWNFMGWWYPCRQAELQQYILLCRQAELQQYDTAAWPEERQRPRRTRLHVGRTHAVLDWFLHGGGR